MTDSESPRSEVADAAREVLPDLQSDHPAADLLRAIGMRLAEDVDQAREGRDRVAASRALMDVVKELDAAPPPPAGAVPVEVGEGDDDDDNPFGIPAVPPSVGDASTS